MKNFIRFSFLVLLLVCSTSLLHAQNFWQQLASIPISSNSTIVKCLATNSKGHIFAGVGSYPTDGVFRSIDGGQSWKQVLETSLYGATWPVYSITINEADHIYISPDMPNYLMRSEDDGDTWESVWTPAEGWFTRIYCVGADTIYGCAHLLQYGPVIFRTYDRGTNWDTLFVTKQVYYNEMLTDMVITSDGVLYASTLSNSSYGGGLFRSFDQGLTWEHIAHEVTYIETMAINSKDDIFIASEGMGFCVLHSGATMVEHLSAVGYVPYDVVIDHSDYIYASCYSYQVCSYDNGLTFTRLLPYAPVNRLYASKDGFLYGYDFRDNYIYRSAQPILSTNEQSLSSTSPKLFPNPANDYITIELPNNESGILSIYDVLGNELQKTIINDEHNNINISNLPSGIHIAKVQTSTGAFISKFIKK